MKRPRWFLFAVLVYVTLDLSVAMMPGAFAFDPDDSVESIQISRGRASTEVLVLPALVGDPSVLSRPAVDLDDPLAQSAEVALPARPVVSCHRPRATLDPAPPSEEPH